MQQVIQVLYSCKGCGISDRKVSVPARPLKMDAREWMDSTGRLVYKDHWTVSPTCRQLVDLKIPLNPDNNKEDNWIGRAITQRPN